jgi:hypothetical protein
MATELRAEAHRPEQGATVEEKVARFRQLFADAPQYAKTAVENVLDELKSRWSRNRRCLGWRAPGAPGAGRARFQS